MLPHRLLIHSRTPDGRVVPRWLGSRDEPWLRELVAEAGAASGRPAREIDDRLVEHVARTARSHGASRRLVEAVWAVERKRWKTRVDAPVAPALIRRTLFPLACDRPHDEALAAAAEKLGIEASQIDAALFADRAASRLLIAPHIEATTSDLVERYNLALVQALLHRATDVRALARAHMKRVVSYAKLLGLMLLFEEARDGATVMTLSGPLALFHDTIKYGHALARWVPTLVTTPGWAISAHLLLQGEKLRFDLDAGAPLPRTHVMSKPHDSRLEARLERDLRACASPWRIEREVAVLHVDDADGTRRLVFPDFALVRDDRRVLVEVVGYWTPDYLARKLALLDRANTTSPRENILLCIDEKLVSGVDGSVLSDSRIVTFRKRIDAGKLLERCDFLPRADRTSLDPRGRLVGVEKPEVVPQPCLGDLARPTLALAEPADPSLLAPVVAGHFGQAFHLLASRKGAPP